MQFACFLTERCELLKKSAEGQPEFPEVAPPALETFQSMTYGEALELWSFTNLHEVFCYIRGSTRLQIPPEWKPVVPRAWPSPVPEKEPRVRGWLEGFVPF